MTRPFDHILFTSAEFAAHVRWWDERLGLAADGFSLEDPLCGHPAPGWQESEFLLDPALREQVDGLVRGNEMGVLTVLTAAYALTLTRHTDSDVVVIRTPRLGGTGSARYAGTEEVALVLDMDEAGATARDLLLRTRQVVTSSYEFQDLPPAYLAAERGLPWPGVSSNVLLSHESLHRERHRPVDGGLGLHIRRRESDLVLVIGWDGAAFAPGFAAALIGRFERILRGLAEPDRALRDLSMLSEEDSALVLREFNATARDYPRDRSIVELFEEQVARDPEATALVFGDQRWTYDRLNRVCNQLARHLVDSLGIAAEDRVGVMTHRSDLTIISLLSVLKAGGAYVPLDSTYPEERTLIMVRDAAPKALLIHSDFIDKLILMDVPLVTVDLEIDALFGDDRDLPTKPRPDQLAYVMYTSGSTGVPKGVMVEHRPVVRLTRNTNFITIEPGDHFLQMSSLSFDASTLEIWGPLLNGATLHMTTQDTIGSPHRLGALMKEQGITSACVSTSLFNQLVDIDPALFAPLTWAIVGGEKISPHHVHAARKACPRLRVVNGYGPTENTTYTTCYEVAEEWVTDIPIGRPIANTRVYIVGRKGDIKPAGVVGEICAAGDGLARGYLGSPEMTAARFVNNPFEPGATMYRTGDLGFWLPDGRLAYRGRRDHQVKIRGFRVELGEIEAALARNPDVKQTVVLARERDHGPRELVAYVTGEPSPEPSQLRAYLAAILPDYMVPGEFIVLDAFPLTPNGKVDRKALPDRLRPAETQAEAAVAAPRSELETKLVAIWEAVLEVSPIGIADDFFDLGGHSLVATRLVSRIYRELSAEINISDVFVNPTIEQLAEVLADQVREETSGIALRPLEERPYYDLSPTQRRMWILNQLEGDGSIYNIPRAYRLEGSLDRDAYRRAIEALVARHESLRTTFPVVDGVPRQAVHAALPVTIHELDLRSDPDGEARARAIFIEDANTPFDLEKGPLFRVHLIELGAERFVHCFNVHHIVSDEWSSNIMIGDLVALYNAFRAGHPSPLQPLPVHYKDYAAWQLQLQDDEAFQRHRRYWHETLAGELPVLELPTDRPRPRIKTFSGTVHSFTLTPEQSEKVRTLARQQGTSVFITLLAVLKVLLYRLSGHRDIVVGTPVSDRQHEALEQQIGFYLNTIVLRSRVAGDEGFRTFLARLMSHALEAYDHQSYPFDLLVDELGLARDLSRNPLFEVMVVGHNLPFSAAALDDVTVVPLAYERDLSRSQFDLAVDFEDRGIICVDFEYNTDLFDASTIERMSRYFAMLVDATLDRLDAAIDELGMLPADERERMLALASGERVAYSQKPVINQFEERAAAQPERVALVSGERQWTYRELDRAAGCIAVQLVERHEVHPGDLVALCLGRPEHVVMAMLGIWKAGAAYVVIDPAWPAERKMLVTNECKPRIVLLDAGTADTRRKDVPCEAIDAWVAGEGEWATSRATAGALAYLLYTSGSTGRPKGVLVEHAGVLDYVDTFLRSFALAAEDVVLTTHGVAFDASVEEIFPVLCAGGRLVLSPGHGDVSSMRAAMDAHGVTVLSATPHLLKLLNREGALPGSVRLLISGGDVLHARHIDRFFGTAEIYNSYGPTEATVCATFHRVTELRDPIPIGKPIANHRVYVLDAGMQPAPMGVEGEIWIGGAGLARGYLNRSELTREAFVASPFDPGDRLYRTGDRGRWAPDGTLLFCGRNDEQLSVRGYRIEAAEVERALAGIDGIVESAVVAEYINDSKELVAYLVTETDVSDVPGLRRALAEHLPAYMIPSYFVALDDVPRTPSGEIDRRRLSIMRHRVLEPVAPAQAPGTEVERFLVETWKALLGRDTAGIHDDFFALGGHSLKAVELQVRIREHLGCTIPLVEIYRRPTIAQIAELIEAML